VTVVAREPARLPRAAPVNPTEYGDWSLRPVQAPDVPMLYEWVMDPRVNHRWTTRGMLIPYDKFAQRIWDDVLVNLLVHDGSQQPLAWATLTSVDLHSGHCSAAVVVDPQQPKAAAIGPRTVCLMLRYAFAIYPFRKIYFESPEFAVRDFRTALGRLLTVEGILTEHLYYAGRHWDMYILGMTAQRWAGVGQPYMERVFRGCREPAGGQTRSASSARAAR